MFKNIFLKTLYDKRWSTFIWFVAVALFSLFVVVLFPTFRESFGEALKDVPDSLKGMLGEAADYQHINGYVDIQVINQMVFLTLIMGIILGTGLIGGEESDGRLQTLLAQPVSRSKVYWQKFSAMSLMILAASAGVFAGTVLGAIFIGELQQLELTRLLLATIMTWLVTLIFGALALAAGAITGKKGTSGIVAGFLAFSMYMVTALAATATALKSVNNISPFKYFNTPSIMKTGLDTGNLFILIAIIAILALAGWFWFARRDVYQK